LHFQFYEGTENRLLFFRFQNQKIQLTRMVKVSGGNFRIDPVAPEYIRPPRTDNGASGILVERKPGAIRPIVDVAGTVDQRLFSLNKSDPVSI
jgi:hypothetical protein